ncbi:AAA family ATPase [uncultured Paludibaculum sp.]|uniref:AAA family ATPase n=1 Tax=uncultured Paludibaculum sp. TaxID=1765020 RepID=UPI002AAB7DEA|nr:AAA family ATPase [uncultured Paludibaculum sp.]
MRACPQDPTYHEEGDVWVHVRMVCESLVGMEAWRRLPATEREIVFAAALLHDVAKPSCTRHEDGRITTRGHSPRGAVDARRILWGLGVDFAVREQICALVRHHQAPFHLIERADAQRRAFLISQTARCNLLVMLARADALGRRCSDQSAILEHIALFEEYCCEQDCLLAPRRFPSAHSRFLYFRAEARDPDYLAYDDTRCEVTLLSGLPGSGKDTWIAQHLSGIPVVSLDVVRESVGAEPTGSQGAVIQTAREQARTLLRDNRSFAWNATNLSRDVRRQLIDLFTDYGARVRIVYVEVGPDRLFLQNRNRQAAVPEEALQRLMDRWQVPEPTEADEVECWLNGKKVPGEH